MIKSIEFDCNRLGKLFLDFTKPNGTPYDTIVLVGENGCGKTTILNSIENLYKKYDLDNIDRLKYILDNHSIELINKKHFGLIEHIIVDGKEKGPIGLNSKNSVDSKFNICSKGFAYSKARSGFKLGKIINVTARDIDSDDKDFDNDDYSDIKQLLIDIDSIDSKNFYSFSQSRPSLTISEINEEFDKISRMSRFKNAFNSFFENIQFEKIGDPINNSFPILFRKNGIEIDVDNLSTGEKQIVCRGGRLLKNIGKMDDSVVLIDEPELSLHPRWQKKILDYYCDLFKKDGKQIAQIIIATHSELVIESALKKDNCLVIVLSDDHGLISSERIIAPDILGDITISEINYKAFNIYSSDYHNALYSLFQEKVGTESSIEKTDEKIFESPYFDKAKHYKPDNYGKRTYRTLPSFIRNAMSHPNSNRIYSYEELIESTELLRLLCKDRTNKH